MTELIVRYVKLGVAWGILIGLVVLYNNIGCRQIKGAEMEPNLSRESFPLVYAGYKPEEHIGRDQVVYFEFHRPGEEQTAFAGRVIGLPGDQIRIVKGEVFLNGSKIDQSYVGRNQVSVDDAEEFVVPRDSFYVLMDNRQGCARFDSRGIGPVGMFALVGKVKE